MDVVATVADSESPAAFAPEPDEAWAAADPRGILFAGHPLPMWVFDRRNRSFLAVNDAAVRKYGYSREEFLAMTLGQVCSPEERARPGRAPRELLESDPGGPGDVRKHRAKSGQVLRMQVASSRVRLQGREAVLSVLHDVSPAQRAALGDALTHLLSGHSTGPPDKAMQCLCGWLGFEAAELSGAGGDRVSPGPNGPVDLAAGQPLESRRAGLDSHGAGFAARRNGPRLGRRRAGLG